VLRPNILAIYLTIVLLAGLGLCGCGGGTATTGAVPSTGSGGGIYSGNVTVSVNWPQEEGDQLKEIPSDTQSFTINIYEAGGSTPVVPETTLLRPQTQVTIENVPLGPKVIYILGFNQANQVVAYGYQDVTVVAGDNPASTVAMTPGSPTTSPTGNVPTVLASGLQSPMGCGIVGDNMDQVYFAQAGAGNGTISVNYREMNGLAPDSLRMVENLASGLYFAPNNSPTPPNQVVFNDSSFLLAWTEYAGSVTPGYGLVRGMPARSAGSRGAPIVYEQYAMGPTGINAGDFDVTWLEWGSSLGMGYLKQAPTEGGSSSYLAFHLYGPLYLANANSDWYWTQKDGTVQKLPMGGSNFQTVMSGLTSPGYIVSDGARVVGATYVYVADTSSGGQIWRIPVSGGSPIPITTPENSPAFIHVGTDGYIYYTVYAGGASGAGSVKRVPVAGGNSTVLASGLTGPGPIGSNNPGTAIGWSEYTGGSLKMLTLPAVP